MRLIIHLPSRLTEGETTRILQAVLREQERIRLARRAHKREEARRVSTERLPAV